MPFATRLAATVACVLTAACAPQPGVRAGDAFPPGEFPLLGRAGRLQLPGPGPLVVNVWATWCAPCRGEMQSLERLHRLAPEGVRVVGLSADTDRFLAEEFLRAGGLTFANALASPEALAGPALAVTRFPTTFVVDRAGVVRWREEAARDWADERTLERLRAALGAAS